MPKRSTASVAQERRAQIFSEVMKDQAPIKAIAASVGLSPARVYTIMKSVDISPMFVTRSERHRILQDRAR